MKISKLLVLSALWLVGLGANAADLVERTEPTPAIIAKTPVAFEADHQYILFNTGTQEFFSQGLAWGTKACACPEQEFANRLYFTKYVPTDGEWDGKTYIFKIYSTVRSKTFGWHECFFDSEVAMFVDRASQANFYWEIEDAGDNVYHLLAAEANPSIHGDGLYVGRESSAVADDGNLDSNREYGTLLPLHPKTSENIDWVFYDAEPLLTAIAVYEKAQQLKSLIETAEDKGVNVDDAVAVYNNPDATLEQIEVALTNLSKAMNSGSGVENGTPDNPTDATEFINNPNFDNASNEGWLGTAPNMVGSGSHGPANVAEVWNNTYDTYQELIGIPNGIYGLSAFTTFRGSWNDYKNGTPAAAKLYADPGEEVNSPFTNMWSVLNKYPMAGSTYFKTTAGENSQKDGDVTYYSPNDPSAARLYFECGYYFNSLVFSVASGTARIGVKNEAKCGDGCDNWSIFDTFRLIYYGNEPASYGAWVAGSANQIFDAEKVTKSYLSAYESLVNNAKASASDQASAMAAFESIKTSDELAAIIENLILWTQYEIKVNEGKTMASKPEYENAALQSGLAEAVDMDYEDHVGYRDLDNDGLREEIKRIDDLMEDTQRLADEDVKVGQAVSWLRNADFDSGNANWTISKGSCNFREKIAEAYNSNFDLYQEHKGAKKGVYKLNLQGFFRMGRSNTNPTAWDMWTTGEQKTDAGVYIGTAESTNKTYLKCIFEEQITDEQIDGVSGFETVGDPEAKYANDMTSAAQAFKAGLYHNTAYGIVRADDETLRVGVGGDVRGDNWICWDNMELIYLGYEDAEANAYLLDKAVEDLKAIDTTKPMGKKYYDAIANAQAAADEAKATGDGAKMFDALSDFFDLKDKILASQALFADLNKQVESLMAEVERQMNMGMSTEAMNAAANIAQEIQEKMGQKVYEDEDVPGLLAQISAAKNAMKMPEGMDEATDSSPVVATTLIESADYGDAERGNLNAGWVGDTGNFGNDDNQKSVYAYEFFNKTFDHYQIISGLKKGAYEISVTAFNRYGGIDTDYEATKEGTPNTAYLYAETDGVRRRVELPTICSARMDFDPGIEGAAEVLLNGEDKVFTPANDEEKEQAAGRFYIPNDMKSSVSWFEMDLYKSTIIAVVAEDGGTLRIGVEKTENQDTGWCMIDNWKMIYYGANSSKEATGEKVQGIETAVNGVMPVKVEYYTLDGRKANAAQKGIMIMRQTMNNGSVVVRKIQK